jgi:hypothetical protein
LGPWDLKGNEALLDIQAPLDLRGLPDLQDSHIKFPPMNQPPMNPRHQDIKPCQFNKATKSGHPQFQAMVKIILSS